ncbi:hypothetical protein C2767_05805 [Klebsiella quasipneumoniae]|nr:hypothetical protein DP204_05985 [Klebsiella quasipneumoniae subsp. quasipneumoniae]QEY77193.1 hypothetical protein C2767_05805 [Klebsiella quasipneumoniae]
MRHSGRSDAAPLVRYHGAKQHNYLKVKEFNKTSNKSSVTGKKPTFAEYFIDKKAINKNL